MIFELYSAIEEDEEVIRCLISFFESFSEGDLVPETTNIRRSKSKERYRAALIILANNELISRKSNSGTYVIKDVTECRRIMRDIKGTLNYFKDAKQKGENPYKLVLNLPITDSNGELYGHIRNACPDIYGSIVNIIKEAKQEIVILNPFFDNEGVNMVGKLLAEKSSNGVKTVVITRYSGASNENNRRLITKLKALFDEYPDALKHMNIFDYKYTDSEENEFSFHAKIVLADKGEKAYLGSANITGRSLDRMFEVGVILSDSKSRLLYEIVMGYMKEGSFLLKKDIQEAF